MKKTWISVLLAAVLLCGLLTACGTDNSTTEEGMKEISALQYANALALFEEAEEKGENPRLIARGRGIAFLGQAEYGKAITQFLLALELSDGFVQDIDYDLNYYLAEAYIGKQDYESAEEVYTSILEMEEQTDGYYLRGNVRLMLGQYTAAVDDFDHCIEMSPKDYDRLIQIYQALDANGYGEAGKEYLENGLEKGLNSMTALEKGKIYYYLGEYQSAAVSLEEARSGDNNNTEASLFLGKSYEAVGEYNYASNVYDSYLARNPEDAVIYNQLGLCLLNLKDYEGALEAFQSGLRVGDTEVMQSLAFNEIVTYEYLGEFQKAEALILSYVATYPTDETALREQLFLSSR